MRESRSREVTGSSEALTRKTARERRRNQRLEPKKTSPCSRINPSSPCLPHPPRSIASVTETGYLGVSHSNVNMDHLISRAWDLCRWFASEWRLIAGALEDVPKMASREWHLIWGFGYVFTCIHKIFFPLSLCWSNDMLTQWSLCFIPLTTLPYFTTL